MDHEDLKQMLPLHALASLDHNESQALEQHLAGCAECRKELDGWRGTASNLAYVSSPVDPSPRVRTRILESIRSEDQNHKSVVTFSRPPTSMAVSAGWSRGLQAIAAIVLIALIASLIVMRQANHRAQKAIEQMSAQLQESRTQLEKEKQALRVLTTPGARMAELAGTKEAPGAHAMLAVDMKSRRAVFMAQGLPQAPAGKAYQLWFISGTKPMPGHVFKTDAAGNAMMMDDQLPPEALTAGAYAVTLEPQEGVEAPTGAMYLLTPAKPAS